MTRARISVAALLVLVSACQAFLVFDDHGGSAADAADHDDAAAGHDASDATLDGTTNRDAASADALTPVRLNCPDPLPKEVQCEDFDLNGDQFGAHGWDPVDGGLTVDSDAAVSPPDSLSVTAAAGATACLRATLESDVVTPSSGLVVELRFHLDVVQPPSTDAIVIATIVFGPATWEVVVHADQTLSVQGSSSGAPAPLQSPPASLSAGWNEIDMLVSYSPTTPSNHIGASLNGTVFATGTLTDPPSHGPLSVGIGVCEPASAAVSGLRFDDVHVFRP